MHKVLIVTNMLPRQRQDISYYGIFVQEQADALEKYTPVKCDFFTIDGFKSKFNYIITIPRLLKTISSGRYDTIHVHYGMSGIFLLANPFKKWRNVILTFHGGDILTNQKKWIQVFISKLISLRATKVILLNEEMKNAAKFFSNKTTLIPCGVDTEFFSGPRSTSDVRTLVFAGDPTRWVKNYPLFEKIIDAYKDKFGEVKTAHLSGLSRTEVRDLLLSSSALIMTSHSEGSPQIIKEAMSCDIPVISSDVGDVKQFLSETLGTKIFNLSDSPTEIAKLIDIAIMDAAESPGLRRQRVFTAGLNQEKIASLIYQEYKNLHQGTRIKK